MTTSPQTVVVQLRIALTIDKAGTVTVQAATAEPRADTAAPPGSGQPRLFGQQSDDTPSPPDEPPEAALYSVSGLQVRGRTVSNLWEQPAAALLLMLHVRAPSDLLKRYPHDRIREVCIEAFCKHRRGTVRNPAGWVRSALAKGITCTWIMYHGQSLMRMAGLAGFAFWCPT